MAPADQVFTAWAAESRGGRTAEEGLRPFLFKLYEKGQLTVDDLVPSGADAASIRSAEPFWAEVVKTVIEAYEGDSGKEVGGLARARFLSWALTPSGLVAVTRDAHVTLRAEPPGSEMPTPTRASNPRAEGLLRRLTEEGADLTHVQRADMAAQGASCIHDLVRLSVTVLMGRPISTAEVKDMTYFSHPFDSDAYKKASKRADFPTFHSLAKAAMKTGDLRAIDEFTHKTIEGMLRDTGDSFLVENATRYMRLWLKSRSIDAEEPRVGLQYLMLMSEKYMCRGYPELEDHELIRQAEKKKVAFDSLTGGLSALSVRSAAETRSAAGSSVAGSSDPGSSVSAASTSRVETLLEKFAEKLETIESRVTSQGRMVENLSSRVGRMNPTAPVPGAPKGTDVSEVVCHYCRQKGHLIRDCPKLKALEEKRGKAEQSDDT